MRKKAREILFEELERSGWQWVIFNEEFPDKNSGIIECIIDAMEKYKKSKKNVEKESKNAQSVNKCKCQDATNFTRLKCPLCSYFK